MSPSPPPIPRAGTLPAKAWNLFTKAHIAVFRATRGKVGGRMMGAPVLLLHHVGRKSGQPRVSPLLYAQDGPRLVVVGSAGGAPKHPAWWINLRAQPETEVELPGERRRVRAREADGEERERLWRLAADAYSDYDVYASRTDRRIPVVVLEGA